jgi:hypothetical protein
VRWWRTRKCEKWEECEGEDADRIDEVDTVDFLDFALMADNWLVDCFATPAYPSCVRKP